MTGDQRSVLDRARALGLRLILEETRQGEEIGIWPPGGPGNFRQRLFATRDLHQAAAWIEGYEHGLRVGGIGDDAVQAIRHRILGDA